MKHILYVRACLCGLSLLLILFLSGCAIFSPIGNAISQGYENTTAYFNGYYNAKRLFTEAEDEIRASAVRVKDTVATQAAQIPATAKQKLGQVIDKCSNILAFHSTSNLVDDALLLTGKSFYYQMEYLKAERKFAELLVQYPNSNLILETRLWYARTEEKLGKIDESIRLGEALLEDARSNHEREIEIQVHRLLASLYWKNKQTEKTISEYEKIVSSSKNDETRTEAQINLADTYFSTGEYRKAAEVYLQVGKYTYDIYSIYYSRFQASVAFSEIGEYQKGVDLIDAMIKDARFKDYRSSLLFERANLYAASGKRNDAITEYIYVDTSYAKTDYGIRSAHKLARLYEKDLGNYKLAYKYYTEVNLAAASPPEGRRKDNAFTRYFAAWRKMEIADSLFAMLKDSTLKHPTDSLAIVKDSINKHSTDTLTLMRDSTSRRSTNALAVGKDSTQKRLKDTLKVTGIDSTKRKTVQSAVRQPLPSADSLNVLKAVAAQELGDVFYDELNVPDSAFYWYNKSLALKTDRARNPRILYILSELSRMNPDKKFPQPQEYYDRLDRDYPESVYADEARIILGKEGIVKKSDPAVESYVHAEKQIEAKEYDRAIETLQTLTQSYPNSVVSAKSEFAKGWLYENYLGQPDSALAQYRRVAKNFAGTLYAQAASRRFSEIAPPDTTKKDTVKTANEVVKPPEPTNKEMKDKNPRLPSRPRDAIERREKE